MKSNVLFGCVLPAIFSAALSCNECAVAAESATPSKQVVWSTEPVVFVPNSPKPMKYFQNLWGSSVYPIGSGRLGSTIYGGIAEDMHAI